MVRKVRPPAPPPPDTPADRRGAALAMRPPLTAARVGKLTRLKVPIRVPPKRRPPIPAPVAPPRQTAVVVALASAAAPPLLTNAPQHVTLRPLRPNIN